MDIIWSCLSALFLCLWTMLHLNVPANEDRFMCIFWRKSRWLVLGVLAPELPMLFACGQRSSAVRSVRDMRALGYSKDSWGLTHGFYADSGGFVLKSRDFRPFPLTAKQLAWLIRNKYLEQPSLSREEIWDKSKADSVTKALALIQTMWLVLQMIGRGATGLCVTPFELSSMALCATALATLAFWWHKPLDVHTPTIVSTDSYIADILMSAGEDAKDCWFDTPLDFVEGPVYMSSRWSRLVCRWICGLGLQKRPLERIPDDRDPQANDLKEHIVLALGTAAFASIHFAGWTFEFEFQWECWLWRGSCIMIWVLLCIYGSSEMFLVWHERYTKSGLDTGHAYKRRWPHCLAFFVPAGLYLMARIGLLIVAVSSMASLPLDAYEDIQWSNLLPHI